MASSNASYEIQIMRDGRWCTESYIDAEDTALAAAKRYLIDKTCEGARVVRNWARSDGRLVEKEIFSQTRTVRDDGPIRINQIDHCPPKCEQPEDYYGTQSRAVMSRLLRNYLDKVNVTPTELIHNYRELKRIQEKDTLVPSAVDRVAFLQTRESEQDSKGRRDEIHKSIDQLSARARRAEGLKLPKLKDNFRALVDQVSHLDDEADYLAMVVLSADLANVRNWLGKLERLCKLAVAEADPHALELLDGVIADVLGSNVVQEILGWQPSLAMGIVRMLDLAEGCLPMESSEAGDPAEMLNALLREGKLPTSRACLVDRAHRQLRSANPLYRSDSTKEKQAFAMVIERVLTPTGRLLCGPETADALTARAGRMIEEGGAIGRRIAIQHSFNALPDRATGLIYLCDLARSEYAREHATDIAALLDRVLEARELHGLCLRTLPPKDRMIRAATAHAAVLASPFPANLRAKLTDHIDQVLERYLIDEQIIEKLDHQDAPLRDRAIRLVHFCAAGVLPEGRAMNRARGRILELLRAPNFDARFVDGIPDPAKAQKTLRDFHQLLLRAGFGG
jgi:hypothetical protein